MIHCFKSSGDAAKLFFTGAQNDIVWGSTPENLVLSTPSALAFIVKEIKTHSFCLALCHCILLLLPSQSQTSGSAPETGSQSLEHVGYREKIVIQH